MMEHRALDPYEQQLLKVFDSYDYDNKGSLDRDGLTQLCQNLQLEERGNELIKCLLSDSKHNRATFTEFKDALLALLGNIQNSRIVLKSMVHQNEKFPEIRLWL
ncbi:ninein [Holotrichia oblita]|uniref:Ninein n=1 Tax=Holotrichia oblita TaxID=644536 RepID=A0ACB9T5S0_HOLOL|nr:ninein [Holotrichia oblita]